jgi:hypothetical protein
MRVPEPFKLVSRASAFLLRVIFTRNSASLPTAGVPSAAERRGNLAEFDSLCLDSFRASQMPLTE